MGETKWRTEPTPVEKVADELWLGEKFQSNLDIAGSPRNSFRASVEEEHHGGRALNSLGPLDGTETYQTPNAMVLYTGVRLWGISFIVKRETAQTTS